MTAALIPDETVISGAAREPEVVELCEFLSGMGAEIEGAGSPRVKVRGRAELGSAKISVIGDRIEAATYLSAAVMTAGSVVVEGISAKELSGVLAVLSEMGAKVEATDSQIRISSSEHRAVSFRTEPFPGVATDAQPLLMAAMTNARGECQIEETIFENRFGHAREYRKFGADIALSGRVATVRGVNTLTGASAEAGDIRAAAGLVLMGLVSAGESRVFEIHHLDRGYERMVEKLKGLGAKVVRVPAFDGEEIVLGC
jgi:UDP-N-acetylglucosamine 1-carboxyvinyltransferase